MSQLIIEDLRGRRTHIPLKRGVVTLGRQEGSTIRLNERNVSRRHLELRQAHGGLFVVERSRYGSMLNGTRFSGRERLYDGDVLQVGDYKLIVEHDGDVPDIRPDVSGAWLDYGAARFAQLVRGVPEKTWRIDGPVVIGSGAQSDIRIDAPTVLEAHCDLHPLADCWQIAVCDPATTLRVNGKVVQRRVLQRGDRIQLGKNAYRWTPEAVLAVSVNPQTVGKGGPRPKWHNWQVVSLLSDEEFDHEPLRTSSKRGSPAGP